MPYTVDRDTKCVYKKTEQGTKGAKVGCTRGSLQKYLAALHANERPSALKEIKRALKESKELVEADSSFANNITFFVVEKPQDPAVDPLTLFYPSDPMQFANQVAGGLRKEDIHGFFLTEEEADNAAHDLVKSVFEAAQNLETKKSTVATKLQKAIDKLQKEINSHMKMSKESPADAQQHDEEVERRLAKIKEYRAKLKAVEGSKRQLETKDDKESTPKK